MNGTSQDLDNGWRWARFPQFSTVYRDINDYTAIAFPATQFPDIDKCVYADGMPVYDEGSPYQVGAE